jgi:hypothetical protein
VSNTGATSTTAPPPHARTTGDTPTDKKSQPLTDAEFLAQQANDAKAALAAAFAELKQSAKNVGDVTLWTQRYPWMATGAAAVAGFVASYTLVPGSRAEAKEQWEHIKAAVGASKQGSPATVQVNGEEYELHQVSEKAEDAGKGIVATLIAEGMKLLRPMLAALVANATAQPADTNGDGAPDEA